MKNTNFKHIYLSSVSLYDADMVKESNKPTEEFPVK